MPIFFYDFITPAALIFFKKYAQIIVNKGFNDMGFDKTVVRSDAQKMLDLQVNCGIMIVLM